MGANASALECGALEALGLEPCLDFLRGRPAKLTSSSSISTIADTPPSPSAQRRVCAGCEQLVEEYAQGSRGELLCRACLRSEDEALLGALTDEERHGLQLLASVLDSVSWKYWKPGEQPAKLLDWLFLGDLKEATDFDLLENRGIGAVLNLINWWELSARLPEVADFPTLYSSHNVDFLEVDAEDRLFFDILDKCWPESEAFLESCRDRALRVLVNCKAGHNRSASICICWLVAREHMTLVKAVEWVQQQRGTILSNHGFRLQLVRWALRVGRVGEAAAPLPKQPPAVPQEPADKQLVDIIAQKRLTVRYDYNSKDYSTSQYPLANMRTNLGKQVVAHGRASSIISDAISGDTLIQRTLKTELLACLYHQGRKFLSDYEYTSTPPTVIGTGYSGDVVLCKRRERAAVKQNNENSLRCVKRFHLRQMGPDKLEKLKNEVAIYLTLEHPHIARLFDAYEDAEQVSLVMQYCSGGTLENALKQHGAFTVPELQKVAVPMLLAVNYIHRAGIVHRDIKPRNWVYESDGASIKLIDFGFSVKSYLGNQSNLQGCMGTLGYLAPEVVQAGTSTDTAYTQMCDIWSLGVVFLELLTGEPCFHKEAGQCDGYTEEVVLREIREVTEEGIEALLAPAPQPAVPLLRGMLTRDATKRPSAHQALHNPFLAATRVELLQPPLALPVWVVVERFRAQAQASRTSRAWLLAVARSPTCLPWREFCALRDTFKMFDARGLSGTVDLETFIAVVGSQPACADDVKGRWEEYCFERRPSAGALSHEEIREIWKAVCGEQESLSYCEFLAVLLPPIDDVFQDVNDFKDVEDSPRSVPALQEEHAQWNPQSPVSHFLSMLQPQSPAIFEEDMRVSDVVAGMIRGHHKWVIIHYRSGRHEFFDYMDINHKLLQVVGQDGHAASGALEGLCSMAVGKLANCSGHSAYYATSEDTPLIKVLCLISGQGQGERPDAKTVRRVPIVNDKGEVVSVFSCLNFLDIALRFKGPTAVFRSLAAKAFDRRNTILQSSVLHGEPMLQALRIMDSERLTICPTTSRELSGDLGGVVASNVVSVSDLKWIIRLGNFDALNKTVSEFVVWRTTAETANLGKVLRQQRLNRFNVVSAHEGASLHVLAKRLLASRLQRIFLASDELARLVGIVSSRDILLAVLNQLL